MNKEPAKELIEGWFKKKALIYGFENVTLPIADEVIYTYNEGNRVVVYTLRYCMSVYSK